MENTIFKMNKSLATNLLSLGCVIIGVLLSNHIILNTGLFALSGAITNWLAIHMLFEKVPGLYGTGVIPARFEDFKTGIHNLVMGQFFSHENMEQFFKKAAPEKINLAPMIDGIDFEPSFDTILTVVMSSSFAPMISMIGGTEALMPMKEPFVIKIKETLLDIASTDSIQENIRTFLKESADIDETINKIETIVKNRLDELTPLMVKDIIQEMIRKHLGWLVVWGGVFGGIIGFIVSFVN